MSSQKDEMSSTILKRNSVTVRVPATTANCGPGFDCIGIALDIWNDLTVNCADQQCIEIQGEGEAILPRDDTNLVLVGMKAALVVAQKINFGMCDAALVDQACSYLYNKEYNHLKLPPLHYKCVNRIPFARGLGSSSAAIVSGLVAGLVLAGVEVPTASTEALLNFASAIEGHPDNVAPAIYGGMQIGLQYTSAENGHSPRWMTSHVAIPHDLQCVLFLPDVTLETAKARKVLPEKVSRQDAIFNVARSALLINSLVTGRLHNLHIAMSDKLHQPYRAVQEDGRHMIPLIQAALKGGAHAACLSGGGPAILALTSGAKGDIFTQRQGERRDNAVSDAMLRAAEEQGVQGRIFITHPTLQGAHVVSADPPFSEGAVCHFGGGVNI